MNNISTIIVNYINQITSDTDWDIIIYDKFDILKDDNVLVNLPHIHKWHLNKYCIKIKENIKLHKKCVGLKPYFDKKVFHTNGFTKSTCFCGVTEYAVPIIIDGNMFFVVSAAGFSGELSGNMERMLSKRVNLSIDEFRRLKNDSLLSADFNTENRICAYLETLAFLIKDYTVNHPKFGTLTENNSNTCLRNKYILTALDYISRNFTKDISVADVANICHISQSYLKHLFKEFVGHGVSQEILSRRLDYAKELLCSTDFSIKYIALESGFKNTDYFSTVFKEKIGLSPLEYRKTHKNKY